MTIRNRLVAAQPRPIRRRQIHCPADSSWGSHSFHRLDRPATTWRTYDNDVTGIVMVRTTPDGLQIAQAAIQTLGGNALSQGALRSASTEPGPEAMRHQRYGLGWQAPGGEEARR